MAPVLTQTELREAEYDQRPIVTLRDTPSLAITTVKADGREAEQGCGDGVNGDGWVEEGLRPGAGGEAVLKSWMGWTRGKEFDVQDGGLVLKEGRSVSKL